MKRIETPKRRPAITNAPTRAAVPAALRVTMGAQNAAHTCPLLAARKTRRALAMVALFAVPNLAACSGDDNTVAGNAGNDSRAGAASTSIGGGLTQVTGGATSVGNSSGGAPPSAGGATESSSGGATPSIGGATNSSSGGQATGGQRNSGGTTSAGGVSNTGGARASGGASVGGNSTTGGVSATGGRGAVGGRSGVGGRAAGGAATGGVSTGGAAAGGAAGATSSGTCSVTFTGATGDEPGGLIPVCCTPTTTETTSIDEVFALLNAHRAANGLSALAYDDGLEITIQAHCLHMDEHSFFDHTSPETSVRDPGVRIKACNPGITLRSWAENIAQGQRSPSSVMTAWTNSSGHNANMLSTSVTRVGIGFVAGSYTWGQVFAR